MPSAPARRALVALAIVTLVGAAAVARWAATDQRPIQQGLGVFVRIPVARVEAGAVACQASIGLVADARAIKFNPGTPHSEPGPAIRITVNETGTRQPLGAGKLPGGFDPRVPQTAPITTVRAGHRVDVCFKNEGPGEAILFGDGGNGDLRTQASIGVHPILTTSYLTLNGRLIGGRAMAIVFPAPKPRSALALIPDMARHAAVFRPAPIGGWTLLILGGLLLMGAPALIAAALVRATHDDDA